LLSALDNLHAALSQWEERYILRVPQAGKVSLFYFESPKQYAYTLGVLKLVCPGILLTLSIVTPLAKMIVVAKVCLAK
jgi:hypothetical protein